MKKTLIAYLAMVVMLLQSNAALLGIVFGSYSVIYPTAVFAADDTPLLDSLKEKYELDNPYRNHQQGTLSESIVNQMNPESNDVTQSLQGMLNEANQSSATYDFSSYQNNDTPDTILSEQRAAALSIGQQHGTPDVSDGGDINLQYATEGTRQLVRDDDGNIVIEVAPNAADIDMVQGVSQKDLVSNEIDNNQHTFNTPQGYGDAESVRENVRSSHDSYRAGTTSSARAYQTITAEIERGVNTTLDPNSALFQPSQDVFEQVNNNEGEFFQSCSTTTEETERELNFPVTTEQRCQSNNADNMYFCEVEREYRVPIIVGGEGFSSCGAGCYELSLGEQEDNSLTPIGGCQVFPYSRLITFNLTDGIELDRVVLNGIVDDHVEFRIDGNLAYSMIDGVSSFSAPLPNTSYGNCEADTNFSLSGDRTFGFERHITQGAAQTYLFQWNLLAGGNGEINASARFYFNDTTGEGFGESFTQYPEGCLDNTDSINGTEVWNVNNGGGASTEHCFAGDTLQCVIGEYFDDGHSGAGCYFEGFHNTNYTACAPIGGDGMGGDGDGYAQASVSEGAFCRFDGWTPLEVGSRGFPEDVLGTMQPMYDGDDGSATWRANLDGYRCDPLEGEDYCMTDPETLEEVCYSWEEIAAMPNQCEVYEDDPNCSETSRECTEGWDDENGDCLNETVTFSCEEDNLLPYSTTVTSSSCDSALPCVNGDCAMGEDESNEKFLEAALMANVIQNVDGDRECEDPLDPTTCRIFNGEAEYCSWEVTGLGTDCCESPGGINIVAYVAGAAGILQTNRLAADGVFGETAQQGAQAVIDFADDAATYVSESISSAYHSVVGNATGEVAGQTVSANAGDAIIGEALNKLQQQAMEFIYESLPEELASKIITQTGSGEAAQYALNETIGSTLSFIGTAYAVYSLAKLALQLLTMCDENEMDMGVKLAQRQCFSVGGSYCSSEVLGICYQKRQDYCCYSSILARIIMEQAGPMLSRDMSDCKGLTQEEFGLLDFDQIDLSEWVGLLLEADVIPTEANEQLLTGGGELVETECEVYEQVNVDTGETEVVRDCYQQMEGGRSLNAPDRQTVSERTLLRVQGADVYSENATSAARDMANSLDCSVVPRPPVCDFGVDPTDTDPGT